MKKYLGLFVALIALTIHAGVAKAENSQLAIHGPIACTMEAKICPDGSAVSRTGPNCEFAVCPNISNPSPLPNIKADGNISREMARQKLEDLKLKISQEKNTIKAKDEATRIAGRENTLQRFDAAVLRINNLIGKVNAEISVLEAKGVDVTGARGRVAMAETKLAAARVKISAINVLLSVSLGELSVSDKTTLKTLAKDTQTLIKDAHNALKDAVASLKDNVGLKMEAERNGGTGTNQ